MEIFITFNLQQELPCLQSLVAGQGLSLSLWIVMVQLGFLTIQRGGGYARKVAICAEASSDTEAIHGISG